MLQKVGERGYLFKRGYFCDSQEKSDLDEFEEVGHQSETVALGPHRHPPVSPSESSHSISDRQS